MAGMCDGHDLAHADSLTLSSETNIKKLNRKESLLIRKR